MAKKYVLSRPTMSAGPWVVALFVLAVSSSQVIAQGANNVMRLFSGIMQNAVAQATLSQWKKLPDREVLCVDDALRRRGTTLQAIIQNGVTPTDVRIADIRAVCRSTPATTRSATGPSFNCAMATYLDERTICASEELSRLDKVVAAGYEYVRSIYGDQYAKLTDGPLLQARRACQDNAGCIKDRQIEQIRKFQSLGAPVGIPATPNDRFGSLAPQPKAVTEQQKQKRLQDEKHAAEEQARAKQMAQQQEEARRAADEQARAKKMAELQEANHCQHLKGSKAYFVATCIVAGMERGQQLKQLEDAKKQQTAAEANLDCSAAGFNSIREMSNRSALKILGSTAISPLMDFADAISLECKKAAETNLEEK